MKRDARTPFYDIMCRVEEDCTLAIYFNKVINELDIVKILFAPKTFEDTKEENRDFAERFYQSCLWELWFYRSLSRLHEWDDTLNKYFSEYEGKWKFYACSKRIESINEYGGEESDYNEDGSIRTLNLTEDDLRHHTALGEMVQDDWRDIVQETTCADLQYRIQNSGVLVTLRDFGSQSGFLCRESGNLVLQCLVLHGIQLGNDSLRIGRCTVTQ